MCWDDAEYIHKTTNHSVPVGNVTIQLFSTFSQHCYHIPTNTDTHSSQLLKSLHDITQL